MITMPAVGDATIGDLLARRAVKAPADVYVSFAGRDHTIGEVDAAASRMANALLASGLQPGDRVALMLPSHPDHIVAILALARAGLVRVPVNTSLIGASLAYPFEKFSPQALLADTKYAEALAPVLERTAAMKVVWRADGGDSGFAELLRHPDETPPRQRPAADDILAITPSSGTTGAPKGVLKSDRTLRAGALGVLRVSGADAGSVFLLWESLHHGAGVAVLIAALLERIQLVMVDRFSASGFWEQVRTAGVTHIHYLGGVLPILLKQPPSPLDRQHAVRAAWGGGCPAEVWQAFADRFGVGMHEGYGLSEMTTFVTANVGGPVGSIGQPLSYFDIRLLDAEGAEVPAGTPGEIAIRNRVPGLQFLGYFQDEAATAEARRDGWFLTGDLATRDADGNLFYGGRKKDSLRRRGINISAWEVERVIAGHDAVEECALVPVPSELGDDELKIFLRTKAGATLAPAEFLTWCRAHLPHFQVPRFVEFIDEFPKTPTQRIRKMELSRSTATAWDAEASR
jgi:crotonobetaine/carnitine-CoA ligase